MATNINSSSLDQAITIAEADPTTFGFQNKWLIDLDDRIKYFSYADLDIVTKRSSASKADDESVRAHTAESLLRGHFIGSCAVMASVPEVITPGGDLNASYLVSEYLGPDMNEQYYSGKEPALKVEDLFSLVGLLADKGISFDGLLPRNTIVTDGGVRVIDWEGARFHGQPYPPSQLARTGLAISWSYIYGSDVVSELELILPINDSAEIKTTDYERMIADLTGYEFDTSKIRRLSCSTAVSAEAHRGQRSLLYKLDDAFHVIGEQLPVGIEVLMDMLLAVRDDESHFAISQHISAVAKSLHEESSTSNKQQALDKFQRRCSLLLCLLVNEGIKLKENEAQALSIIDKTVPPTDVEDLCEQIKRAVNDAYPNSYPKPIVLRSIAQSVIDFSSLNNGS